MSRPDNTRVRYLIALILALATFAAYWQVQDAEFVNYDDDGHVTANPYVQDGPTWESLKWAFTTTETGIRHPLTWMAHMLACRFSGLDPRGHHLTSLFLHILNAMLLFFILLRLTGAAWRSAFVAALFALHPLHVESVAWVSELKDVLSTFFFMLTLWAYAGYVESPNLRRYLTVVVVYILGLLSKPMLVTLPFVLLLLDYWPLGRFAPAKAEAGTPAWPILWKLLREKLVLLLLAAAASVAAYLAQRTAGTVGSVEIFPVGVRVANAAVAYVHYIGEMIYPRNLAVFYPHPGDTLPTWHVVGAVFALVCISGAAVWLGRKRCYLTVGWMWYVVTLLPVIGLVQVGDQAMADRYTYIPLIGVFIVVAWGVPELLRGVFRPYVPAVLAGAALAALAVCTWIQVGYWRDSVTLFEHALRVTRANYLAHHNLGTALWAGGDYAEAVAQLSKALKIKPDYASAHFNLGLAFEDQDKPAAAEREYRRAIKIQPDLAAAHNNLGLLLGHQSRPDEAIREYRAAIRVQPDFGPAHYNLAVALYFKGDFAEAWKEVHLAQKYRVEPHPDFLIALSEAEPEPME